MYVKVFSQIFDSSIADNYPLRHFFMDLLVLADADGCVDMTPTAIAARTRIPLAEVTAMLAALEQPDHESRTPDHDGRRIVKLDTHRTWGWCIINYARFRQIASEEQRREKTRIRTSKWREKGACDAPVTHGDAGDAMQKQKQKQRERENAPPKILKPSSTAERIAAEKQLKILNSRLNELVADTSEQWQRDAEPGKVTEKNQLRAEITELENSLLCNAAIFHP